MEFAFVGPQTPAGWEDWTGDNYQVTDADQATEGNQVTEGGVVLATQPRPTYVSPEVVIDGLPDGAAIVDFDLDECGTMYLLTEDGTVYQYDPGTERLTRLACTWYGIEREDANEREGKDANEREGEDDEDRTLDPQAICVTADSLYLADGAAGRIHALSRHLLQTRWIASQPFDTPVGLATFDGVVQVLDRGPDSGDGFLAALDERGTAERIVTGLDAPQEFAIDADGNRYVLDRTVHSGSGPFTVRKFGPDDVEVTDDPYPLDEFAIQGVGTTFEPSCIEVGDEDEIFAGVQSDAEHEKTLLRFVADDRVFERILTFERCVNLLVDRTTQSGSGLYAVDDSERSVSFLTEVTHNSQNPVSGRYDAQVRTRFDSGESEMEWHRVSTDFDLEGTDSQVRLRYAATDDEDVGHDLDVGAIRGIGSTYADRLRAENVERISELVELSVETVTDLTNASETDAEDWLVQAERLLVEWKPLGRPDPRDALLEEAVGRYLWVEVSLVGTESTSPRVTSLRAYFPRQSYLRYLPAIYREDRESAAFLERYLSIFESVFTDIETEIESSTRYVDSRGIRSEHLSWLARWLAVDVGETWPEAAERRLLERAPDLFKMRGTREGILEIIRIFLEIDATAENQPSESTSWDRAREREDAVLQHLEAKGHLTADEVETELEAHESLPAVYDAARQLYLMEYQEFDVVDSEEVLETYRQLINCPQCFTVMIGSSIDDEQLRTVRQIVDAEQPAHAAGRAIDLEPRVRLGSHTYLGINSTLPDRTFVLEDATLGADSVLTERESGVHLGRRSRLDGDGHVS